MARSPDGSTAARNLALAIAQIADDEHGSDIEVLQVGEVTIVSDFFVLVSAANKRLSRRLTDQIEARIAESFGDRPIRREGVGDYEWVVIDYGDVMVHIFSEETRDFYEIERLYADVPSLEWGGPRPRIAGVNDDP